MAETIKIGIIVGSTRPGRKAEAVANWFHDIAKKRTDAAFELVDIQGFDLPLLDERTPPSMGRYTPPTRAWAAKIERDLLARGIFTPLPDLARQVRRYITCYNEDPKPIRWTYADPSRRITATSADTVH